MRANNAQLNLSDDRQKEYQRQQERLKAMTANPDKVKSVSADLMIENLLKDSFKRPTTSGHIEKPECSSTAELPQWLQSESLTVPPQYKYLWSLVQLTFDTADTQKVSQLLLTSGLQIDVLGYIWNLANKAIPGQLTKQEFYIILALVGLAQSGHSFNNLSSLKLLSTPSIPILHADFTNVHLSQTVSTNKTDTINVNLLQGQKPLGLSSVPLSSSTDFENQSNHFYINNTLSQTNLLNENSCQLHRNITNNKSGVETNLSYSNTKNVFVKEPQANNISRPNKNTKFPCIGSSPTAEIEDDFSEFQSVPVETKDEPSEKNNYIDSTDDFTDFQSANVEPIDPLKTVVITQKREIPKIPLPKSFTGKLSSFKSTFVKISPESERKLKVLSQSESLSSLPESKISSSNKVSTSITMLGGNHGIGSRLANHSLGAKLDRPKHHKHHKIKISSSSVPVQLNSEEDIILGVKMTNTENLIPKCCPKKPTCKTFILKETKIRNDETAKPAETGEITRQIEIPMLGTLNETTLPSQAKLPLSNSDLISVQEDKYSALREVELEINHENSNAICNLEEGNDDFGDFLSANILTPSVSGQDHTTQSSESNPMSNTIDSEEKESWGEWNFNANISSNSTGTLLPVLEVNNPVETISSKTDNDIFDSFDLLTLNETVETPKHLDDLANISVPKSDILFEQESSGISCVPTLLPKNDISSSIIDLDIGMNEKANDFFPQPKPTPNHLSNTEFWDLFSSEPKPSPDEQTLSRHGSLPSLDLKMSQEESDQEVVWRRCLESCYYLIQEGFDIFNNITVKSVMDEVFTSSKTIDYLNGLNIVYQISKRITQNYGEVSSLSVDKIWTKLQELCFEYNIKLQSDELLNCKSDSTCAICLGNIGTQFINQGTHNYHPSCANLWINCVEETLPSA